MQHTSKLNVLAGVVALALVSAMVLQTSTAAFSGSTSNGGNSWGAGTVSLSDSRGGTAMFTATNWKPTDSDTQCINVTYTGSIVPGAAVELAASVTETTIAGDGLGNDLDVTVAIGALGTTCAAWTGVGATNVYVGTLADMTATSTAWTPTASGGLDSTRAFNITVTLGSDTPDSAQGEGAAAEFTWSATS